MSSVQAHPLKSSPVSGPRNDDTVNTAIGLTKGEFSISIIGLVEMLEDTHVPTVALGNISLTLPPATLRKAAPQNPVTKRKIRKTTAKVKCLVNQ